MKPTASFRLSKTTKRSLALSHFRSEDARHSWKRAMIDAELCAEHAKRTAGKRSKEDRANNKPE